MAAGNSDFSTSSHCFRFLFFTPPGINSQERGARTQCLLVPPGKHQQPLLQISRIHPALHILRPLPQPRPSCPHPHSLWSCSSPGSALSAASSPSMLSLCRQKGPSGDASDAPHYWIFPLSLISLHLLSIIWTEISWLTGFVTCQNLLGSPREPRKHVLTVIWDSALALQHPRKRPQPLLCSSTPLHPRLLVQTPFPWAPTHPAKTPLWGPLIEWNTTALSICIP